MATYTLTTGVGYNNYSSHVVGYESERHRREMFSFTVPSTLNGLPVLNPKISTCKIIFDDNTWGQHFGFGADPAAGGERIPIYISVGEGDYNSSTELGTVTISGENTTFNVTKSVTLTPGKTYTLYVYATKESYGWYWFGSGYTKLKLEIDYVQYTNCGAPTSISVSPSIQKPGGTITVSWSGATAGVANDINGYTIWYRVGDSNNSWVEKSVPSSYSKVEFNLPTSATRGAYIDVCIRTLGKISGYNSSDAYKYDVTKINSLPATPSVTASTTIIPSGGGEVKFTAAAGKDTDTNQTRTLYYSTSESGTKTKFDSPLSKTLNAAASYYFWTYDGLEFSKDYTRIAISKNTAPTLTVKTSGNDINSVNKVSGYRYIIAPKIELTPNKDVKSTQINIQYSTASNFASSTTKIIRENSTSLSYSSSDIRGVIGTLGCYYRLCARYSDGVEWSSWAFGDIYYLTKTPGVSINTNNTASTWKEYCGQDIILSFDEDDGFDQYTLKDATFWNTIINSRNLQFKFDGNITALTSREIAGTVGLKSSGVSFNYDTGKTYQQVIPIPIKNLAYGGGAFRPFDKNKGIANFTMGSFTYPKSHYGLNNDDCPILEFILDDKYSGQVKVTYGESSDPASFQLEVGFDDIAKSILAINPASKNYSNSKCKLTFTNVFKEPASASIDFPINLVENFTFSKSEITGQNEEVDGYSGAYYNNLYSYLPATGTSGRLNPLSLLDFKFLKEKMPIFACLSIESYWPIRKIILYRKDKNSDKILAENELFNGITKPESNNKPYSHQLSIISKKAIETIGEILQDMQCYFSVKVLMGSSEENSYSFSQNLNGYDNISLKAHRAPTMRFIKADYYTESGIDENGESKVIGKLRGSFCFSDYGGDGNGGVVQIHSGNVAQVKVNGNSTLTNIYTVVTGDFLDKEFEFDVQFDYFNVENPPEILYIAPILETHCRPALEQGTTDNYDTILDKWKTNKTVKEYTYYPLYNVIPTVAYRKNLLGINILEPLNSSLENAAIVIGTHSGKSKIYFKGEEGLASLDMLSREIDGIKIDGGSW